MTDVIRTLRLRLKDRGIRWVAGQLLRRALDMASPPWMRVFWLPVSAIPELGGVGPMSQNQEPFWRTAKSLTRGVRLYVVRDLDELNPQQRVSLTDCVGESSIPLFRERLARGIELHIMFVKDRVVGTVFFVIGSKQPFQHVILTDRDAMGLDGRIAPAMRGLGLYPILLLLSVVQLKEQGMDRVFADCAEWNTESIRSLECLGFRYLVRYKLRWGAYRYERRAA